MSKTIVRNGKTAILTVAKRRNFTCTECPRPIFRGEHYWVITLNGAGLGNTKFPDRTHVGDCLENNLGGK